MKKNISEFNGLIEELIQVLDKVALHLETSLEMLDQLRAMVIKRDEKNLNLLLENVRIASDKNEHTENRRNFLRKQIALRCGWPLEQTTLTNLAGIFDEKTGNMLLEKRNHLSELLLKLKTEHMSTSMLLNQCSRFNSVMLNALLNGRQEQATYSRGGQTKRSTKQNMVNLQL